MTTEHLRTLACAYAADAKDLRTKGAVALAQRCDAVARYLRYAADEMDELRVRGVNPQPVYGEPK